MKRQLHFLSRLAAVVALPASLAAAAAVKPNPYAGISASNVFRLLPPPSAKPVEPPPQPRPPLPQVSITGLVEVRGVPRALVEITPAGKPVQRTILAVGATFDVLEILQIDVAGERVRVRLGGDEEVLGIEKPRPPAPAAVARPAPPPLPAPSRPAPVFRG